jgi:hypothetical protein
MHFIEKMNCFIDERVELYRFAKPRKSVINFYLHLLMNSSPQKIIQLSVLFFAILGTISCNKENDLMAEYVVSASIAPSDSAISTSEKDADATSTDTVAHTSIKDDLQLTEMATATNGTVAIDDVTNTIIYTPAAENPVSTPQGVGALGK